MEYRKLGNTGMDASVVGLGAEHLVESSYEDCKLIVDACFENGINIMDIFMPQFEVHEKLGRALKGRRDKMILQAHIGSVLENGQSGRSRELSLCKPHFEAYLKAYDTDYMDIGMMFFVDNENDYKGIVETPYLDYVQNLKKSGTIRAIGASTHSPVIGRKLVEEGLVDMLMFSINPAYDMLPSNFDIMNVFEKDVFEKNPLTGTDPQRTALYELCEQKGVGITVMKTLGAGRLIQDASLFGKTLTVGQCIHYALSRPAVVSCMIGCKSPDEVNHAAAYCTLSNEEKDFSQIAGVFAGELKGKCMYCNHCLPCPVHIDVAMTMKLLDIARHDTKNIPDSVKTHYNAMLHKASECIACKKCEAKCPFQVEVVSSMAEAALLLES